MEARSEEFFLECKLEQVDVDRRYIYRFLKRLMDIVGAVCGLIILLPLLVIIALWIKSENISAPIFFKQTRVGKKGKTFNMFKFRSMCVDAEKKLEELLIHNEAEGAMFKIKEDPRITKVGKFIRNTSIDELPQLLNVLRGDMSLVGPRPPLPREVAEYQEYDLQRLYVTPGCTGLWQVSGRSSVGFKEMVELDIKYIQKANIFFDLKIMLLTVKMVFSKKHAY